MINFSLYPCDTVELAQMYDVDDVDNTLFKMSTWQNLIYALFIILQYTLNIQNLKRLRS